LLFDEEDEVKIDEDNKGESAPVIEEAKIEEEKKEGENSESQIN
jgi:hypothetical protein